MSALLLRKVHELGGASAVTQVLAQADTGRSREYLSNIGNWISYDESNALWVAATRVTHQRALARTVGAEAGQQLSGSSVASLMRSLGSPEEVYRQIVSTTPKYTTIARVHVDALRPGFAGIVFRATPGFPRTAHLCDWTIGLLSQPPVLFGRAPAQIRHEACAALGASECRYEATWELAGADAPAGSPEAADRLREELDWMRERLRWMFATAADLVGSGSLDDTLARIADRAAMEVRAPRHLLVVRMSPQDEIVCHAKGFTDAEIARLSERLMSGEPFAAPASWLLVAVSSAVRDYGFLIAAYPDQSRFLPPERRSLEVYARYAAVALDSAAARLEAERRSRDSGALLRFSREISAAGTSREIAARLAESIPLLVDCDEVGVYLWDGSEFTNYAIERPGAGVAERTRLLPPAWAPLPGGSLERFVTEPEADPVFIDLDRGGTPQDPQTLRRFDFAAAIAVPLGVHDELLGTVLVIARDRPQRLRWSPELSARIGGIAAQATVALENGRLMDIVTHEASHDRLTGLPNRARFAADLSGAVVRATREHRLAALFYLDLDQFKSINDRHGHAVGDDLLVSVAGRLSGCTRAGDTVARLGGDEFALVVTAPSTAELDRIGDRIDAAFQLPFKVRDRLVRLDVSVGCATFPDDAGDAAGLIHLADAAMYADKGRREPGARPGHQA